MARKDVDLVIRAKDEAAKVVNTITTALNEFVAAQATLDTRAKKTESSLTQLGAAIGGLDKVLGGLDVGRKLTQELDKAAGALARIEVEVEGAQQAVGKLSREFANSEAVSTRYATKLSGATAALERQKSAVAKARIEQKALSVAYEESVAAQGKIAARQAALPAIIEKQSAAITKTKARYAELSTELLANVKPSKTLQENFEATSRSLSKQETKLAELRVEYGATATKLNAAGSAAAIFAGQSAAAAASLAKQERVLVRIGQNYAELGVKTKAASTNLKSLDGALGQATEKLKTQSAALDSAENDFVDLARSAGMADAALEALSKQSIGNLKSELDSQRRAMLEAKREYLGLTEASSKMAAEIGRAGVPTRKMAEDFARTKVEASGAKTAYTAQRESLLRMGQAFRAAGTDIESLRATQARFVTLQQGQRAALEANAGAVKRQSDEVRKLFGVTTQAEASARRLGSATRQSAQDAQRSAAATTAQAAAYRKLYGDKRTTLDITQRLRGQVLSMIAAYGGLYGVISLLGKVVAAYQTLEAAQARLNVANSGDLVQTAEDMDFLRRTADRLGVELGTLSQEYSKFAISTKGTNLEGAKTRKIFLSVAEAARVNRSSNEELSGVFVALTQIVSKGAVQMEELRQQLGDRLPGALQIMADGLGVTTAKLIKMMEAGEVTSEALVPFAEELDRRFGPGLGEALAGTTVALGRLKNAAFQALVQFGNAGFIDSFTKLANDLTDLLKSADFQTFVTNASAAFSVVIDGIAFMARNFELFVASVGALGALLGVKVMARLAISLGLVKVEAAAAAVSTTAAAGGINAAGAAAAGAAARVTLLGRAMAFLMSSTGLGLAVAAIGAGIALWSASANDATEAMNAHLKIMDEVKNAYDQTGDSVEAWRKAVKGLTITEATRNLDKLVSGLKEARAALIATAVNDGQTKAQNFFGLGSFVGASQDYNRAVDDLIRKFIKGGMSAKDLLSEMDALNQVYADGSAANKRYGEELIDSIKPMVDLESAISSAEKIIIAVSGSTEDAAQAIAELNGKVADTAETLNRKANSALEKFQKAMGVLRESLPDVSEELVKFNEEVAKIESSFESALAAARALPDAVMRIAATQEALRVKNEALLGQGTAYADKVTSGSLVDRIIGVESGGNASAKNPNSSATGLGQFIESTWLKMFKEYFPDRAAGMTNAAILALREDAAISRSMVDLYIQENGRILQRAGVAVTDANLYLAHFLGPGGAKSLLKAPPGTQASDVLSPGQVKANSSILSGKSREEVIAWAQRKVGISEKELVVSEALVSNDEKRAEDARKAAEDAAKDAKDQREATAETLAEGQFAVEQQERVNAGKERQAAIEAAIRSARADDPNITQAEIDKITEQTGKVFDLAEAHKSATTAKEKAEKAEERINDLLSQRGALVQQLEFATKAGDTSLQEELRGKIAEVNTELVSAIDNAQAMWAAVGGSAGDAAVAKLQAAKLEAQNFSAAAEKNYADWTTVSDLFVNRLGSAFDSFAQKVAEGQSVGEAARDAFLAFASDFLREIAQMIIKQAIFNALKSAFGGTSFGTMIGLGHTGGVVGSKRVGSGNASRRIDPSMFSGAQRYHTGGVIGLRPGEVPIIAKQGEEMLTEDDPFHSKNRGALSAPSGGPEAKLKVVNGIDSASFLEAALNTELGERVLLNWMRANADAVSSSRG